MRTSAAGLAHIAREEGEKLAAYHLKGEQFWTIGVGHYGSDVKQGMRITLARSRELLRQDIKKVENALNAWLKKHKITLSQTKYDVMVSMGFNLGPGVFVDSSKVGGSLRTALRSKKPAVVASAIMLYVHGAGGRLPGLVARRTREARLYLGGPVGMTTQEVQAALHSLGWPIAVDGKMGAKTKEAIKDFQLSYYGGFTKLSSGYKLAVDGKVGPRTTRALKQSLAHGGKTSPHFTFREFADKQTGRIRVHRDLIYGLEMLRKIEGPIGVLSGYRDPSRKIGAANSMHKYGGAMDPIRMFKNGPQAIARLKVFSGIGVDPSGRVRHLDVRGSAGLPNFSGGTKANPSIFVDNF